MNTKLFFAALLLAGTAVQVSAQSNEGRQGQGGPGNGPPQEAIAACSGKAAGAACSFSGRQGEQVSGTCFSPPAGGPGGGQSGANSGNGGPPMACRPARNNRQ